MAPKRVKKETPRKRFGSPFKIWGKDPAGTGPTTSKDLGNALAAKAGEKESCRKKCFKFIYNKETKAFLGRTCRSWLYIISYSVIYLLFLCTYTMIFLFTTLTILKHTKDYSTVDKIDLLTYSEHGIGLSATPTSESNNPLIWYKVSDDKDYKKYVSAIDRLLVSRRDTDSDYSYLGPCSTAPYGYGRNPCVIVRMNRQWNWSGKPLGPNSTKAANAPKEVKEWLRSSRKLWLHCDGYHSYDKEHIGRIQYFPNPPGFDPNLFPLDVRNKTPLVAIQISDFTQGVSVAVECNLWYENGPSSIEFMLYVEPDI